MKKYNRANYGRYKDDVDAAISSLNGKEVLTLINELIDPDTEEKARGELVLKYLPLVENVARRFSTTDQASGVLCIEDLIQEGSIGLVDAVKRVDPLVILEAPTDPVKRLTSFLSRRINGEIRRAINNKHSQIRIPEDTLRKMMKDAEAGKAAVRLFFNKAFRSIEAMNAGPGVEFDVEQTEDWNPEILSAYVKGLMAEYLDVNEYQVLRLSYGIDCDKRSALEIADFLNITEDSRRVMVSRMKRKALDKLIENVKYTQVIDYM